LIGLGYGFFGGLGIGGGSTMMILFLLAIGVVVYLLMNQQNVNGKQYIHPQPVVNLDALEIAKSRLANGEITVEEFEQIKKNLL
jgi:putative membrane protein